jgi:hypothetical protein
MRTVGALHTSTTAAIMIVVQVKHNACGMKVVSTVWIARYRYTSTAFKRLLAYTAGNTTTFGQITGTLAFCKIDKEHVETAVTY